MKRGQMSGLTLLAGLAMTSTAWADWQYTKWGMTVSDVAAASGGKATPYTNEGKNAGGAIVKLQAPYVTESFAFQAFFLFGAPAGKLARVSLDLVDVTMCPKLYEPLFAKYGLPDQPYKEVEVYRWRDEMNNNVVSLTFIANMHCSLSYWPVLGPTNQGL